MSLGTPALQRALQALTATPADLHLLQPYHCPQFTTYAFTYASTQDSVHAINGSIACYVKVCNAFGTVVIHVGTSNISDRCSEVLKKHYQTLLDTTRKKTCTPGSSSQTFFPLTGGASSGSTGSSRCSPGSTAGAPLTAWAT
ncbi:hypothetical protein SRHO_G00256410 [Serrasalmus rhombeus]